MSGDGSVNGAGRWAPSPTGDLHLGNLRTALLAWLFARSTGRELVYRDEDLDAGRVRPGVAERQRADVEELGLDFDRTVPPQSTRGAAYAAALERLRPHVFDCFCTRRDLAEAASAPHGTPGHYPGTCRDLTAEESDRRRAERAPAWRLRAGGGIRYAIDDRLHGRVEGPVDDLVVRRADGTAGYHLAVVMDDGDAGIDQVVRGDDLLDAAVSQAYLASLLGLPEPSYAHVPLALGPDGRRLAKRDGAVTLAELAALGVGPDAVLTRLATSLGLADPGERVTPAVVLERFDADALPRSPWVVEVASLGSVP